MKLATFWAADPEVWFAQTEAQFASRNPPVTVDSTKFNHVAAALDNNTASEVRSIILNPPANNKYDALKVALIRAFGKSQAQKDRDILNLNGLGDRRPTALLRHINSLNADPATLKRALFLAQLPVEVRRVLAASTTTDLEDLAVEADKIVEAGTLATTQVSSLAVVAAAKSPADQDLCYFHSRFGKEAQSCRRDKCPLSHLVPTTSSSASGNAPAGR